MKWLWTVLLVSFVTPVSAQVWKVDPARSEIRFVIKQMNVPVEGGFKRFTVNADFDLAKPEQGTFRVEVDVASIDTGSSDGDAEALRPAWFDAARHPKAVFVSRSIRRDGPGRFVMSGDLTVKGRTRTLSVPLVLTAQRSAGWLAQGRFALKRSDFDIGGGEWSDPSVVANDIDGRFKILLLP